MTSLIAQGDIWPHRFVSICGDHTVKQSSSGDQAFGSIQRYNSLFDPGRSYREGDFVTVETENLLVQCSGRVLAGQSVGSDHEGKACVMPFFGDGFTHVGVALENGDVGDIIRVTIQKHEAGSHLQVKNPWSDQRIIPFLRAIAASPRDDTPRLVFADWLDDAGEDWMSRWATYIRVSCEHYALKPCFHADAKKSDNCRRCDLTLQMREYDDLRAALYEAVRDKFRLGNGNYHFSRGFPEEVRVLWPNFQGFLKPSLDFVGLTHIDVAPHDYGSPLPNGALQIVPPYSECSDWQAYFPVRFHRNEPITGILAAADRASLVRNIDSFMVACSQRTWYDHDETGLRVEAVSELRKNLGYSPLPSSRVSEIEFKPHWLFEMDHTLTTWGKWREPIGDKFWIKCSACKDSTAEMKMTSKTYKRNRTWRRVMAWGGRCAKCKTAYYCQAPSLPLPEKIERTLHLAAVSRTL